MIEESSAALSPESISAEHKKVLYNRFHVLKHKAKTNDIPFHWAGFDAFLADVIQRYSDSDLMKEQPFDPNHFRLSLEPGSLISTGKGYCQETLGVLGYPRKEGKPTSRRKPVRSGRKANATFVPKMGEEALYTESEAVKLFKASAQLAVLLQELDGDIDTLISLAHQAADAMSF